MQATRRNRVEFISFSRFRIPLTPEEHELLERRIAAWIEENGVLYGFIKGVMGDV